MIVRRQEEPNGGTSEKFLYVPIGRTEPEDGIGMELIDDDDGRWVVFEMVDRSYSAGILRFTHETSLAYDFNADMWSGYEIGVEDWDFTPREAAERAREFKFDRAVHELCVFLGEEPPAFNLPPEIELPPDYVHDCSQPSIDFLLNDMADLSSGLPSPQTCDCEDALFALRRKDGPLGLFRSTLTEDDWSPSGWAFYCETLDFDEEGRIANLVGDGEMYWDYENADELHCVTNFDDECVLIPSDLAFKLMTCYATREAVDDETVVELLKTVSGATLEDCPQAFREAMATRLENGAAKQQGRRI